jgi:predicted small lipoprotein YifL
MMRLLLSVLLIYLISLSLAASGQKQTGVVRP